MHRVQERIMTLPYGVGAEAEVFKYSLFLVFCNRAVTACIAAATLVVSLRGLCASSHGAAGVAACTLCGLNLFAPLLPRTTVVRTTDHTLRRPQLKGKTEELRPIAPLLSYASVSLSNVVATTCQYEALKHVTFAVQTLGKCAKMFPVMIWGFVILRKRYSGRDVALALAITAGCFVFFMSGPTSSRLAHDRSSSVYGILLMLGYLSADGYTSTFQQRMFKGHAMTSYNQVLFVSLCSIALSSFGEWLGLGAARSKWASAPLAAQVAMPAQAARRVHGMLGAAGVSGLRVYVCVCLCVWASFSTAQR
jgi:adenosine 3'-phospho 5'-phosphosulfate transporter B2